MKRKDRWIGLLVAFIITFSSCPSLAFAEEENAVTENAGIAAEETVDMSAEAQADETPDVSPENYAEDNLVEAPDETVSREKSLTGISKLELKLETDQFSVYELMLNEWYENGYNYEVYFDDPNYHMDDLWVYSSETEYTVYHQTGEEDDELRGAIFRDDNYDALYVTYPTYRSSERIAADKTYSFSFEVGSYNAGEFGTSTYNGSVAIKVTSYDEDFVSRVRARNDAVYELEALVAQKAPLCRDAQKAELQVMLETAREELHYYEDIAGTLEETQNTLSRHREIINAVKTDAQLRYEEVEIPRQGVYDGSLPKIKISKPKASKKAITAKWKKLKKKQLKAGVSNIEVWVCSDGAFAYGTTIEKFAGKKKSSLKIKGLQKGVTYYVKVRAIKHVGGTKYVGPWSAVKKIKVKK